MPLFPTRFKSLAKKLRGPTSLLASYRKRSYGRGASDLGKDQYTYDPETGVVTSINAPNYHDEDLKSHNMMANFPAHIPPPPGKDQVQEFIDLEDISPEFGRMYYLPTVGPQHSYIHHLENSMTQTVIVGRESGNLEDLPSDDRLPNRARSDTLGGQDQVKRKSEIHPTRIGRAFSDWNYQKPQEMNINPKVGGPDLKNHVVLKPEAAKVSVGTAVTESLYNYRHHHEHKDQIQPIKQERLVSVHATISEPIDYYVNKNSSPETKYLIPEPVAGPSSAMDAKPVARVSQPPIKVKKSLKKSVSWGAWTLLEFIHVDDPRTHEILRSTSEPNIGQQNLSKCPNKSSLR